MGPHAAMAISGEARLDNRSLSAWTKASNVRKTMNRGRTDTRRDVIYMALARTCEAEICGGALQCGPFAIRELEI